MSKEGKIKIAREFRKNLTESEKIMWSVLRGRRFLGLKFRRQHLIEGFLVDFFCRELNLALEIDGSVHDTKDNMEYDAQRQRIIEKNKTRFIRIRNEDIERDLKGSLDILEEEIKKL